MSSFKNKIFVTLVIVLMNFKSYNCNITVEGKTSKQSGIIPTEKNLPIELSMKLIVNKINQRYFYGSVSDYENNNLQQSYEEINKFKETLGNDRIIQSFYHDINYLQKSYNRFFPIVTNKSLSLHTKGPYIIDIVKRKKNYRLKLSSLIKKFIVSNQSGLSLNHRVFDIIINNYKFRVGI